MKNYEKAYKEALKVMESLYNVVKYQSSSNALLTTQKIEKAFPELKELEDERIRKELIEFVKSRGGFKHEYISWLEKQGEQKPADKVEPKFKIGDTIHRIGENSVFPMTIEKIEDGDYVCNNSHSFVNIKFQDDYELVEQKHTWSEEDEKLYTSALWHIKNSCGNGGKDSGEYEVYNWLKSIKPNRWKPSEEQLHALFEAHKQMSADYHMPLITLYYDLKSL